MPLNLFSCGLFLFHFFKIKIGDVFSCVQYDLSVNKALMIFDDRKNDFLSNIIQK